MLPPLRIKKSVFSRLAFACGSAIAIFSGCTSVQQENTKGEAGSTKTCFQVAAPWSANYSVDADASVIYGVDSTFEDRVKGWRDHGYTIHFMTGIAWGNYQDYFTGKFDGQNHFDDAQTDRNGNVIWHGEDVPYVIPSSSYLTYIKSHVKKAIDNGAKTIFLEEPEFWARAGYSESFKKEWAKYYGTKWVPQHQSPEATYLSSKLKYHLYTQALDEVFTYAKNYAKSIHKEVTCMVPTHSLLNYSAWEIVSPEANLASLKSVDGYIAQVWTGTSRVPVYYNGKEKERVFENAFLEYGAMASMVIPTGRKIYFLTDPIEDAPRSWNDYRKNYQATYSAQLLYPEIASYEVMPWPRRIYEGKFRVENEEGLQPISPAFATQMQIMIHALNQMPKSENKLNGSQGIGILAANSMMFQRFPVHNGYEDPRLSNFYGLAMPLLKKGVPVQIVHIENTDQNESLDELKVLVMSYANMKPLDSIYHLQIAAWVKKGGTLIYYGRDADPFQKVKEWWNSNGLHYNAPSEHLFECMGQKEPSPKFTYGQGTVYLVREDPKELVLEPGQDESYLQLISNAYKDDAGMGPLELKNNFVLHRGHFDIVAVMDESTDTASYTVKGPVIDLFDPELPVLGSKTVHPGQQALLYNLSRIEDRTIPKVIAAAARIKKEQVKDNLYTFMAQAPEGTKNVMRIQLPTQPKAVKCTLKENNHKVDCLTDWNEESSTLLVKCTNSSKGIIVTIKL